MRLAARRSLIVDARLRMLLRFPWRLLAALALFSALPAAAQPAKSRPDPADSKAPTASLAHRSALADYRKSTADGAPIGWRDANDAVERIGGWRAYAREAAATPAAPASAPAGPRR
jgi:hypothetical protein